MKHVVNAAISVRIFVMKLSPMYRHLDSLFSSGDRVRSNAFLIVSCLTDVHSVDRLEIRQVLPVSQDSLGLL